MTALLLGGVLAACGAQTQTGSSPTPAPTPQPVVQVRDDATLGKILVAANGLTLYKFANDTAGVSNCKTDPCATRWPALQISSSQTPTGGAGLTGTLGVIPGRTAGLSQVTYNSLPLYFFQGDTNPGDTKGANIARWAVLKP